MFKLSWKPQVLQGGYVGRFGAEGSLGTDAEKLSEIFPVSYRANAIQDQGMTHFKPSRGKFDPSHLIFISPLGAKAGNLGSTSKRLTSNITEPLVIRVKTSHPFLIHFHCCSQDFVNPNHNFWGKNSTFFG